jgi:hypothetical protein
MSRAHDACRTGTHPNRIDVQSLWYACALATAYCSASIPLPHSSKSSSMNLVTELREWWWWWWWWWWRWRWWWWWWWWWWRCEGVQQILGEGERHVVSGHARSLLHDVNHITRLLPHPPPRLRKSHVTRHVTRSTGDTPYSRLAAQHLLRSRGFQRRVHCRAQGQMQKNRYLPRNNQNGLGVLVDYTKTPEHEMWV